jgi:hypothetical protein
MRTFLWNLRFRIAWALLPGSHKHVSVRETNETCSRCF